MSLKLTILLFFLIWCVSCDDTDTNPPFIYEDEYDGEATEEDDNSMMYETDFINRFLFIFVAVFLAGIIRHLTMSLEIAVPHSILVTVLGITWGIGTLYKPSLLEPLLEVPYIAVDYMQYIAVPVMIFHTAFCLDVHTFMKALSQILVLSIPVTLLAAFATGQLMRQMVDSSWSNTQAALFGVIQIPIYPGSILRWFRDNTVHTKYLLILIEGEMLVSTTVGVYAFNLLMYHLEGFVVHWYQFMFGIIRWVFVGLPLGYLFGSISIFLMKFAYNEVTSLMILTLSACYMSFYLGQYIANAGIITCTVTALSMGRERPALFKEVEEELVSYWKTLSVLIHLAFVIFIGVIIPNELIYAQHPAHMYFVVFVTYLMTNILRFFFSLLFSPLLSRIGYGISFRSMMVCVWAGIKSPLCINLACIFLDRRQDSDTSRMFFLHTSVLYILMMLINASFMPVLLRALGLFDISTSKQMNMSNCMKYIYDTRARLVAILKMDRLLSDANWPLVMTSTALRHPYRKMMQTEGKQEEDDSDEDDEEDYFMRYKYTYCPDCQKQVPNEPTMKELKEMTREAKLRLLKHKKTAYSRQYENGMVSKEGARILHQAVELAMDNEHLMIEVDGLLKMFSTEDRCLRKFQNYLEAMLTTKEEIIKMPRRKWRKLCYKIVNNTLYVVFIYTMTALNIILLTVSLAVPNERVHVSLLCVFGLFFGVYCLDFFMKIMAFSYSQIWRDGFKTYFKSIWRIQELVIIVFVLIMLVLHVYSEVLLHPTFEIYYLDAAVAFLMLIRLFRILNFLEIYEYCRKLGNKLSKRLSVETDRSKALAYELGKNYIAGEDEILEDLQQIVDNDTIREKLHEITEEDRLAVARRLGIAELETPWITSVVKTKTAIRTVLKSMKDDIFELKVSGWVDDVECHKLLNSLSEKYKEVYSVKYVEPSPPKMILKEIMYMSDDEELVEFLFANISTRKYDPGNVVIREGEVASGVYILITGMFKVTYIPNQATIEKMKEVGSIPVVDHICVTSFEKPIMEYVTPGNSFGELSTIADRPYEGTVVADTYSEVYLLKQDVVLRGLAMDPDPVAGLKCRIWKSIAFRTAIVTLLGVPAYHSYTQEKIKLVVEKAFVPELSNYKIFVVNDMMQDVILIEGTVVDYNTRDLYVGPCYIPRAVQKLLLPPSSLLNMDSDLETKLMIIPAKDFSEYEVMIAEESVAVLVEGTAKSLRHYLEQKKRLSTDSGSTKSKKLRMFASRVRKAMVNANEEGGSKSRITFVNTTGDTSVTRVVSNSSRSKFAKISRLFPTISSKASKLKKWTI